MEILKKDIASYLELLKTRLGYSVSLHGDFAADPDFVRFNFHLNPYCIYVKKVLGLAATCREKQAAVVKKCTDGAFFGVCHAGVGEFVYPVTVNGKTRGFVSVSGYRGKNEAAATGKALHLFKKCGSAKTKDPEALRAENLSSEIPDFLEIDTAVKPLLFMLENYLETALLNSRRADSLYRRLLRFLVEHRHEPLCMKKIAEEFHCSVSTLSHLFKKESGQSISEYVTTLRLKEAEWILRQSALSVTEISNSLGFCNSAYFSKVFKKRYGLSPTEFKKQCKSKSRPFE